ncbi:MAG: hypothetical protein KDD61_13465 [Bdellovibrionales bacterium]|nr:hypothetical protein [Bdellovibrionales bacterium]
MKFQKGDALFSVGIGLLLSLFYFLGQWTYLADSEIWSMASAKYILQPDGIAHGAFYKPIFNLMLVGNYIFGETSMQMFLNGRAVFAVIGILTIVAQFFFAIQLFKNTKWALVSVFVTAGSYIFLSRGFRVRSDLLATFFLVNFAAIGFFILKKQIHSLGMWILWWTLPVFALLATPKAIFLLFGLLIFFFVVFKKEFKLRLPQIGLKSLSMVGAVSILLIILFLFSFWNFEGFHIKNLFAAPFKYFLETFHGDQAGTPDYLSPKTFRFFIFSIESNPLQFLLLYLAWLAFLLPTLRNTLWIEPYWKGLVLLSFYLVFVFVLFPDKLPFFLVSFWPFLAIVVTSFVFKILNFVSKSFWKILLISALLLGFVIPTTHYTLRMVRENSNEMQQMAWEELYDYFLTIEGATILTGVGLFVKENEYLVYLGQGDSWNLDGKIEEIQLNVPTFILRTRKLDFIGRQLQNFFKNNYVYLDPGLYIRAARIHRAFNGRLHFDGDDADSAIVWPTRVEKETLVAYRDYTDLLTDAVKSFPQNILDSSEQILIFKKDGDKNLKIRTVTKTVGSLEEKFVGKFSFEDLEKGGEVRFSEDLLGTYLIPIDLPPSEIKEYPPMNELFAYDANY